jgi:hypothetical protein
MENFDTQDFIKSATETVDAFFRGFSYPSSSSFTEDEINHIVKIIASVYMTKHNYQIGGGFVEAILDNNLSNAFSRADSTILRAMRIIVYAKDYGQVKKHI